LLEYLDAHDPERRWKSYILDSDLDWSRIVVSGLSQGAGMAAYIAKRKRVARVVLFSSPWDFQGPENILASWLSEPSATPPELWFAEYHRREKTMPLIAAAYEKLRIPAENIRVFDLDVPVGEMHGANPYHVSTISNPAYRDDWMFLFGQSP
jgi:acetyl esterase/lipase